MSAMPNTRWGRDVDAPNTNWRASSEDPLPWFFNLTNWLGWVFRWFALRPMDGHARSDATFRTGGTTFYSRSGHAPFPGAWFHSMPRWKQALITRLPAVMWTLSFPVAYRMGHLLDYLSVYVHVAVSAVRAVWGFLSWLA